MFNALAYVIAMVADDALMFLFIGCALEQRKHYSLLHIY